MCGAIRYGNYKAIAEMNLEVASCVGRQMHPPTVHNLIILGRYREAIDSIEALFLLRCSRDVTVDSPLAKNSSLAHCVETVVEWRQKIRIVNILPAAGSRVSLDVGRGDMDYQGASPLL